MATIAPTYPPANEPIRSIGSSETSIEDTRYRTIAPTKLKKRPTTNNV